MKITELISRVDHLRPNQIEDGMKREWLSDLELLLINEVVLTHELPIWVAEHETYTKFLETQGRESLFDDYNDGELLIPAPYARDVYYWWLVSRIDLVEGNMEKYANDFQMYNNACLTYKDWYNRTYMPIQRTKSFMRGGELRGVFATAETDQ